MSGRWQRTVEPHTHLQAHGGKLSEQVPILRVLQDEVDEAGKVGEPVEHALERRKVVVALSQVVADRDRDSRGFWRAAVGAPPPFVNGQVLLAALAGTHFHLGILQRGIAGVVSLCPELLLGGLGRACERKRSKFSADQELRRTTLAAHLARSRVHHE